MNEELCRDIERFVEENEKAIFEDIAWLVAVNSENGPAEPGKPFGAGPAEALERGLAIAKRMGLAAENCEGRIGYAQLGEGDKACRDYLATITERPVSLRAEIPQGAADPPALSRARPAGRE